jgi:hypothetical protein
VVKCWNITVNSSVCQVPIPTCTPAGSGCETEYVWDTFVDLTSKLDWFSDACSYTNTHMVVVVVRQNMCGVPVWT